MPLFLIPFLAGGLGVKFIDDYFDKPDNAIPDYTGVSQGGIISNVKTIAMLAGAAAITYAAVKWKK